MTLEEYLTDRASVPGEWGKCDCAIFLADWVKIRSGKDPARYFRGTYDTALAARRALEMFGGIVPLYGFQLARAGWVETDDPQPGDVGVINGHPGREFVNPNHQQVGAIRVDGGWATKAAEAGINVCEAEMIIAWAPK